MNKMKTKYFFIGIKNKVFGTSYLQNNMKEIIESAWENRELLKEQYVQEALNALVHQVDEGKLRCAEPSGKNWIVNDWVKKGIILFFPISKMEKIELGPFEFHDKMKLKTGYAEKQIRVVPHAVARYGAYIAPSVVMMPSYINIGAYVDRGTMVDTWATVDSCAQIGQDVHLSGGVGIGGVLEPVQAAPVIIEDGAFIGSRCIIVEGVKIGKEAVIGAGVTLTKSTKIINVSQSESIEIKGHIPPRSVVIPGSMTKQFSAGSYNVNCALIIGERKESTDKKTSLNQALRTYDISV
mgnify:CR=1 FL=1